MSANEEHRILAKATFAMVSPESTLVLIPLNIAAERASKADIAFYCIHSLSGAAGPDFFPLAQRLPNVRFYGVQAPPKSMSDPMFGSSIRSLAVFYADHIVATQPDGPYLLGGWSAGATIALEMAEILRVRKIDVDLLVAFDGAPENTAGKLPIWNPIYIYDFVLSFSRRCVQKRSLHQDDVWNLAVRGVRRIRTIASTMLGVAGGASSLDAAPFDRLLRYYPHRPEHELFIRRLYSALAAYQPPKRFHGAIIVYASKIGTSIRPMQVGRIWRKIAPQAQVLSIKGNHTSIFFEPDVEAIANDLRKRLDRFSARPTGHPG